MGWPQTNQNEVVSPSAAAILFLADQITATAWYHNILSSNSIQTRFGSIEGINMTDDSVVPLARYRSKASLVLGILGGVQDIIAQSMKEDQVY